MMSESKRKIGLEGVKFNAPVGFFAEERIIKNDFMVDLFLSFEQQEAVDTEDIRQTIDYMQLYEVCAQAFEKEAALIETVAQTIMNRLKSDFPFVEEILVRIKKMSLPVNAEIQHSFIELSYKK